METWLQSLELVHLKPQPWRGGRQADPWASLARKPNLFAELQWESLSGKPKGMTPKDGHWRLTPDVCIHVNRWTCVCSSKHIHIHAHTQTKESFMYAKLGCTENVAWWCLVLFSETSLPTVCTYQPLPVNSLNSQRYGATFQPSDTNVTTSSF